MQAAQFDALILRPAISLMRTVLGTTPAYDGDNARLQLLATIGQESNYHDRVQIGGPARGWCQFERAGGCREVLTNVHTKAQAVAILDFLRLPTNDEMAIFSLLAWNDFLAVIFGRLNYWRDSHPMPVIGDEEGAWKLYIRVWGAGKPDRNRWSTAYQGALAVVRPGA